MKKFDEKKVKMNAWVGLIVGVVAFVAGGYFNSYLPNDVMNLMDGVMAGGFVLSNVCFAYLFSQSSNFREKLTRDDLATFSAMVMAQGFVLGMIMMLLYVILPYNNEIVPAIMWSTAGPMSLGFLGIAILFLTYAIEAINEKEWWNMLRAAGVSGLIAGMAVVVAGLTIVDLPNKAFDVIGYVMLTCLAVVFGSVLAQAGIAKLRRA